LKKLSRLPPWVEGIAESGFDVAFAFLDGGLEACEPRAASFDAPDDLYWSATQLTFASLKSRK
jgi:hypothetical protein